MCTLSAVDNYSILAPDSTKELRIEMIDLRHISLSREMAKAEQDRDVLGPPPEHVPRKVTEMFCGIIADDNRCKDAQFSSSEGSGVWQGPWEGLMGYSALRNRQSETHRSAIGASSPSFLFWPLTLDTPCASGVTSILDSLIG